MIAKEEKGRERSKDLTTKKILRFQSESRDDLLSRNQNQEALDQNGI